MLTGVHYARLPAGVEPAPIGSPSGGQQGARAVECPGSALRALTPLPYSLSASMAATAETMGCVRGAANGRKPTRESRVGAGATRISHALPADGAPDSGA